MSKSLRTFLHPNKTLLIGFSVVAGCITALGLIFYSLLIETIPVNPSEIEWKGSVPIVMINPINNNGVKGVLLIRPSDQVGQFIPGEWQSTFADKDLYLFHDQELYIVNDKQEIQHVAIKDEETSINEVIVDPRSKRLALKSRDGELDSYCISEPVSEVGEGSTLCSNFSVQFADSIALWDPEKIDHLVFLNSDGALFSWQFPSEATPHQIYQQDAAADYEKFVGLFKRKEQPKERPYQLGSLVVAHSSEGRRYLKVRPGSDVSYLGDRDHLLVKTEKELYLVDVLAKKHSGVFFNDELPLMTATGTPLAPK